LADVGALLLAEADEDIELLTLLPELDSARRPPITAGSSVFATSEALMPSEAAFARSTWITISGIPSRRLDLGIGDPRHRIHYVLDPPGDIGRRQHIEPADLDRESVSGSSYPSAGRSCCCSTGRGRSSRAGSSASA
jgi:hypothetical protein